MEILVNGGYSPSAIAVPVGKSLSITFVRTDPSPCLEEVVLSDFNIRKTLPLNEKISVAITPQKKGEFLFTCGMNMFRGKIIVR